MGKELSEMTLAELWELFPIFLVQHDDKWENYYKEIESSIIYLLSDYPVERISHIGSTAIQGIWAKNIVDVIVEISEKADMEELAHVMERNGFIGMSTETDRISLNKGYTKEGFADKVYHIHLRYTGDNDELYFRDYLNEHLQVDNRSPQNIWRQILTNFSIAERLKATERIIRNIFRLRHLMRMVW